MILIIGGTSHGKLSYVKEKVGEVSVAVDFEGAKTGRIFDKMHLAIRELQKNGGDPEAALDAVLESNPGVIIICDEIGGGVVPIEPEERQWRETVGRLCHKLAQRADFTERIFFGIPMRLAGDKDW